MLSVASMSCGSKRCMYVSILLVVSADFFQLSSAVLWAFLSCFVPLIYSAMCCIVSFSMQYMVSRSNLILSSEFWWRKLLRVGRVPSSTPPGVKSVLLALLMMKMTLLLALSCRLRRISVMQYAKPLVIRD